MGSFLCCQARRLHLKDQKKFKEEKRSICLHCHRQLKWYDNVPVVSWVVLKGRCRFCHKKIGVGEILAEVLTGVAFLMLSLHFLSEQGVLNLNNFAYFPNISGINWGIFVTTLALTLSLAFLAIYDGLYGELPSLCLTISGIFAIILVALKLGNSFLVSDAILSAGLFGGIYLVLYLISKGRWVGDGDWILAAIIGLALGRPFLALVALFLSNFLASMVMLPVMALDSKKRNKKDHLIYFGPFLVAAYVIAASFATEIMGLISF